MSISRADFGTLPDGRKAELFTLTSRSGLIAKITNYGGRITSIRTPDRKGEFGEITLGYDRLRPYISDPYFLGATIGRYANRIGGARFELDGIVHNLISNEGKNQLHGGDGFEHKLWAAHIDGKVLTLRYASPAGEGGFPGNVDVTLEISWATNTDLKIDYRATTDAPCPINLTNHAYFNLSHKPDIRGHKAKINAQTYLLKDDADIPTGEIKPVKASVLDLTGGAVIGHRFNRCALPNGYDHSYVVNGAGLRKAATLSAPDTGRSLTLLTTQPGLQFYTGGAMKNVMGREGELWPEFAGLCLEGQHHPDSPNHAHFPDTILRPADTYRQTQIYRFEAS